MMQRNQLEIIDKLQGHMMISNQSFVLQMHNENSYKYQSFEVPRLYCTILSLDITLEDKMWFGA